MSCAIAVMAKAPRPGAVKTRLHGLLSPTETESLSRAFLADVTANLALAARVAPIVPYVAYAPAGSEGAFAGLVAPGTRLVLADGSGGAAEGVERFGCALLHATRALLAAGHDSVCLLNADSPTLPTARLTEAARLLAEGDEGRIVLGASEDGGYYLIGLRAPHAAAFRDIAWSSAQVTTQTRQRVAAAGLTIAELAPWWDVDEPAEFHRLRASLATAAPSGPDAPFAAPATRGWFAAWDDGRTARAVAR